MRPPRLHSRRLARAVCAGVCLAFLPLGFSPSAGAAPSGDPLQPLPLAGSIRGAPLPLTGTIQGTVQVIERPARRTAERYPGGPGATARSVTPIPVVVHLEGAGGRGVPSAPLRMIQRDTTFAPALLVVPLNSDVAFPNEDSFFHNVFSFSRPSRFDLGRYPRGESKSVTFAEPGYVKVLCEVHQWMRGAILVVDNPHYAVVDADGGFTITGVPAGTYTLVATDFDRGTAEVSVTVQTGATARVQLEVGR